MAAPKELKSPGSAGRPGNVKAPVPSVEDEIAAMRAISDDDLNSEISAMRALTPEQVGTIQQTLQQSPNLFQQSMQAPSRSFWTNEPTTGLENYQQGLGTTAELLGAAPVVAGTVLGAMSPVPGGALAGGMAGAVFQKDFTNMFRRAFSLGDNEERSRLTDVMFASLSVLPGLGGQTAMRNVMAGGSASADLVLQGASQQARGAYQAMISAVREQMEKNGLSAEQAAEKIAGVTSNLQKYIGDYSESGIMKGLSEAFGKKIEVQNKVNQIAQSVSPESITQESMVKGNLANAPERVVELKQKLLNRSWRQAYEELRMMRGIGTVNSDQYLSKLQGIRESVKVDQDALRIVDNVIENLSGFRAANRDLEVFARRTGGKPPKYYDMETGQKLKEPGPAPEGNIPFPETQEALVVGGRPDVFIPKAELGSLPPSGKAGEMTFETMRFERPEITLGKRQAEYPESEQLGLSLRGPQVPMTAEQQAASLLPPKILENFHISMMEGIDSLIQKRQYYDRIASNYPKESEKRMLLERVASSLRNVEDDFIDQLALSGGSQRQVANSYKMAKAGLFDIKSKIEAIGPVIEKEAFEVADALDTLPMSQVKAFSAVMPLEVRQKIVRRYWDNMINPILGDYEGVLTTGQAQKIRNLYTPERGARLEILSRGMDSPISNMKAVTDELSTMVMRASKVDPGKMLKSPLFPRLLKAGAGYIGMGAPVDAIVRLVSNGNEQAAKVALDRFLSSNMDDIVSSIDRSNSSRLVSWMKNTAGSDNVKVQQVIDELSKLGLAASQLPAAARGTLAIPGMSQALIQSGMAVNQ
jgi:hypothetical protein